MNIKDYNHEGWCDGVNNISQSCNCIVGYPLEVIESLESQLAETQKRLEEAERVIAFYADYINWKDTQYNCLSNMIESSDIQHTIGDSMVGGKYAREYLKKYKDSHEPE
jgi:hypothetical protein